MSVSRDPRPSGEPLFRLAQARAALVWERLWGGAWAAVAVTGAFLTLALANLLPILPGWLHALVLALFLVALMAALVRGLGGFRLPRREEARRRLERDSGLPHRPLQTLGDRVSGDGLAAALWALHQERVRRSVRTLRVRLPHPNLAARDPFALRVLVGLVLLVTAAATEGDWLPRLDAALSPRLSGSVVAAPATLDLWLTPPEYTGLPPIFLKSASAPAAVATAEPGGSVAVPKDSQVLARVTGGSVTPELAVNDVRMPFESADGISFHIQAAVTAGRSIAVLQGGHVLGSWTIAIVPDQPPAIAAVTPPAAAERGALRIEYAARDDYGLAAVSGSLRLAAPGGQDAEEGIDRAPVDLPLGLPGVRPKEAHAVSFHDLTGHPWAGLPATLRLTATDGAGQTGSSEDMPLVLPERSFTHPVAQAIVAERKKLTLRPRGARTGVAQALSELSARPGTFGGDLVVFLALRAAVARLLLNDAPDTVASVQELLWETALRIEDGGLSLAERDLRNAEQRLSEAMERNAPDQELRQLMDELQAALDRFLDAMDEQLRQAMERGEQIPQIPPELAQRMEMVDRNDLQKMLDQMRAMSETGAREAARQMLSQLQQMLENLRNGATAQRQQNQQNQAMELMRRLQALAQQQQQLLDDTFRQTQEQMNQQGMPGGQQQGQQSPRGRQQQGQQQGQGQQGQRQSAQQANREQAERQEALRRELGEVMRQMGEMGGDIPRGLGRAERAMRDAARALQQGQPGAAVPPQTQAMDELQQGLQNLAQQMAQQMMGMGMMPMPGPGMQPGTLPGQPDPRAVSRNRDPLGRRPPGFGQVDGNDVKIPEEADLQRAREILDELRRRSGEQERPKQEREYIDRLLRQF